MKKYLVTAGLICVPVAVWAWQGAMAAIGITESGLQSQIERATRMDSKDLRFPSVGAKQLAAAKLLSEPDQVARMREWATAAKALMMSPTFLSAHEAYIAQEYKAVNHDIKAAKSLEQMAAQVMTKGGEAALAARMKRDMSAMYVQATMTGNIADVKMMFDYEVKEWTENANNVKRSDRAKYAKLVSRAQAIEGLSASDPDKFRRGYAVLKSSDADGYDTEEALFGAQAAAKAEEEQLLWDQHNLRGMLKRGLAQVVAEAPTVDFAAQTVQKNSERVFVNPAYEKKSLTWKAMYRAGKGLTAAGLEVAKAWLKEL
jgi:hypothetical protein